MNVDACVGNSWKSQYLTATGERSPVVLTTQEFCENAQTLCMKLCCAVNLVYYNCSG